MDDEEMQRKIKETVLEILKSADMDDTTEFKVRSMASEKLGLDLSPPDRKMFVRGVVESFLLSQERQEEGEQQQQHEQEEAEEEEDDDDDKREAKRSRVEREYDDNGDLIICRLSNKRRVTVQEFRGKTLLSIREYYEKDGKQLPSSKGISLTAEQWTAFKDAVPAIEDAIKKWESS